MEEKKPTIKVYSTDACPYCHTLKAYLSEKGFAYEDVNVGEDEQAKEEMINKTGQMGVPVADIDGEIVIGFDKAKINQLLKINE